MTFKISMLLTMILLSVAITGCSAEKTIVTTETPSASPAVFETATSDNPKVAERNHAVAYFLIFEDIYETDPGLNSDMEYLAIDLSRVKADDTESIVEIFETYCSDNNLSLLLDTYDGLVEKGYIKDSFFEKGLLISFDDQSFSDTEVVTDASKWRSGLGADGATYTATLKKDVWEISNVTNRWIS